MALVFTLHTTWNTSEQFLCSATCVTADRIAVLISHTNITLVVIVVCYNEWLYSFPCSSQKLPSADAYWAFVNVWISLLSFHFVTVRSPQVFNLVSHRFSFSFSSPGPFVLAFVFSPMGSQKLIFFFIKSSNNLGEEEWSSVYHSSPHSSMSFAY